MGDHQQRGSGQGREEVVQQGVRGLPVQVFGRLVQDDQPRALCAHQHSCQGHPLRLAAGQGGALFADDPFRIQREPGADHRRRHLLFTGVLVADLHVLRQRGGEDVCVLGEVADPCRGRQGAAARRDQPHDGGSQRCLAQAGRPDQRHRFTRRHPQVDAPQDRFGVRPAGRHVYQSQPGHRLGPGRGRVHSITGTHRFGFQHIQDAAQCGTRPGERLGGLGEVGVDLVQRQRHQRQDGQIAGEHVARDHGLPADQQRRGDRHPGRGQLHSGGEAPGPSAHRLGLAQLGVDRGQPGDCGIGLPVGHQIGRAAGQLANLVSQLAASRNGPLVGGS